jgi:hypothetical protein
VTAITKRRESIKSAVSDESFSWGSRPSFGGANEWNELQVRLIFVRTHSPGHSRRFITDQELRKHIRQFLPESVIENTFPLKSDRPDIKVLCISDYTDSAEICS